MLKILEEKDLNNGNLFFYYYLYICTNINISEKLHIFLDKRILTMFKLLPHLIPPRAMKTIAGVCIRASLYNAEKCMIRIAKVCILES